MRLLSLLAFNFHMWLYAKIVAKSGGMLAYPIIVSMKFEREKWWIKYYEMNIPISKQIMTKANSISARLQRKLIKQPSVELIRRYERYCDYLEDKFEAQERDRMFEEGNKELDRLELKES